MKNRLIHVFAVITAIFLLASANLYTEDKDVLEPEANKEKSDILQDNAKSRAEEVYRQVITCAGGMGTSGSETLAATVGQLAVGTSTSGDESLSHGFWEEPGVGVCDCEPGECDATPPINILDIVYLINYKYKSGPNPTPYTLCSGDPNSDCSVNILDIVYLINYKYKYGPAPVSCQEWTAECGQLQ